MSEQRKYGKTKHPVSRDAYWMRKVRSSFHTKDDQEKDLNEETNPDLINIEIKKKKKQN